MEREELRESIRFALGQQIAYDDRTFDWFIENNKRLEDLQAENEKLKEEIAKRPVKPLYGEARSRLLKVMGVVNIDAAIKKYQALKDNDQNKP